MTKIILYNFIVLSYPTSESDTAADNGGAMDAEQPGKREKPYKSGDVRTL